jgi:hypothetical protein
VDFLHIPTYPARLMHLHLLDDPALGSSGKYDQEGDIAPCFQKALMYLLHPDSKPDVSNKLCSFHIVLAGRTLDIAFMGQCDNR